MVARTIRRRILETDDLGIWLNPCTKSGTEQASFEGYKTVREAIREKLNGIRAPEQITNKKAAILTACLFACGAILGCFSKWLDNLALDDTVWWHSLLESLDLGNFFSDLAIWLLAALIIAVFSRSAVRAGLNVFCFFAGMCLSYHVYTVSFSGFDPMSYMMRWYAITLLSPIPAAFCWYSKGTGAVPLILDIGIIAAFSLSCFAIGFFYVSVKGVLYLLVFTGAAAVLYRGPKQSVLSLLLGFFLSFLFSPFWPFR
jgi:hypothetical protein